MVPLSALAFASLAVVSDLVVASQFSAHYVSNHPNPSASIPARVIPAAEHTLQISGKAPRSSTRKNLRNQLRQYLSRSTGYIAPLAGSDHDEEYLVNGTIGGQAFSFIADTGSSDTWVIEKGFKCSTLGGKAEPESECAFSAKYDPKKSKTYTYYPDHNFNITYGGGEYLSGSVAFETVEVGGLGVRGQEIGVVNTAAWDGDGVSSGIFGLCFPNLTSVYKGENKNDDSLRTQEPYDPFFFSAVKDKLITKPYFSVSLNRGSFKAQLESTYDPNLGYLAFGGIAPVATTTPTATVPLQGYTIEGYGTGYYFYIANVDKYTFPGSSKLDTASHVTILDTGTTVNYIRTPAFKAYAAAFNPTPYNSDKEGGYIVECSAQVPEFLVTIGGKIFSIDRKDQLLPLGIKDNKGKDLCFVGTQDGGPAEEGNIFILGDTFLHNVVVTFNIFDNEVTLTQRKSY